MLRRLGVRSGWVTLTLASSFALLAAGVASGGPIHIGGIDTETQYTGFVGSPADAGVLTFDDEFNSYNAAEPGRVTTSTIAALVGADVDFEVVLDTSSFNPATGDVRNARFIGTGPMPEILITNNATVLLAFQVHLLDVQQAAHSGSLLGKPDGRIVAGNPALDQFGISSNLTVAGGTLNAVVGGVGARAVMEMLMSSLSPQMTQALRNSGYLNSSFTNGVGTSQESTTWNITIIPEPSTAVLLGFSLLGLLAAARRRVIR